MDARFCLEIKQAGIQVSTVMVGQGLMEMEAEVQAAISREGLNTTTVYRATQTNASMYDYSDTNSISYV